LNVDTEHFKTAVTPFSKQLLLGILNTNVITVTAYSVGIQTAHAILFYNTGFGGTYDLLADRHSKVLNILSAVALCN